MRPGAKRTGRGCVRLWLGARAAPSGQGIGAARLSACSVVGKFWNDLPFAEGSQVDHFPFGLRLSGLAAAPIDVSGLADFLHDSFSKVAKRPPRRRRGGLLKHLTPRASSTERALLLGGWNLVALLQLA